MKLRVTEAQTCIDNAGNRITIQISVSEPAADCRAWESLTPIITSDPPNFMAASSPWRTSLLPFLGVYSSRGCSRPFTSSVSCCATRPGGNPPQKSLQVMMKEANEKHMPMDIGLLPGEIVELKPRRHSAGSNLICLS